MKSTLRRRLERLEQSRPPAPHLYVACVDADGLVRDDRSDLCRRWVGRHYSELPNPVTVVGGVDLLRIIGDDAIGGTTDGTA
jgi:hypothetical protein